MLHKQVDAINTVDDLEGALLLSRKNADYCWQLLTTHKAVIKSEEDVKRIFLSVPDKYIFRFAREHINNLETFKFLTIAISRKIPPQMVLFFIADNIKFIPDMKEFAEILAICKPQKILEITRVVTAALTIEELTTALQAFFPDSDAVEACARLASCCEGLIRQEVVKELTSIKDKICQELDSAMQAFLKRREMNRRSVDDFDRYTVLATLRDKVEEITSKIEITPDWRQKYRAQLSQAVRESASDKRLDKYNGFEKVFITLLNIIAAITVVTPIVKYFTTGSPFFSTVGKPKEAVGRVQKMVSMFNKPPVFSRGQVKVAYLVQGADDYNSVANRVHKELRAAGLNCQSTDVQWISDFNEGRYDEPNKPDVVICIFSLGVRFAWLKPELPRDVIPRLPSGPMIVFAPLHNQYNDYDVMLCPQEKTMGKVAAQITLKWGDNDRFDRDRTKALVQAIQEHLNIPQRSCCIL